MNDEEISRHCLKTIPYRFEMAISGTEKQLHCLSESSYERLKAESKRVLLLEIDEI